MKRYGILDELRGITLVSMILYHAVWDLVYVYGVDWKWFYTPFAYVWQQSICWTFILLSGFCWSLGHKQLRRGLIVSGAGLVVMLVTELFTPGQRIRFGVLTLLGIAMLVMIPLEKLLKQVKAAYGAVVSLLLFLITRNINDGNLGFEGVKLVELPEALYHNGDIATLVGFTDWSFFSTDYFSVIPWLFLFVTGYFLYRLLAERQLLDKLGEWRCGGKLLAFMGKQSLIIYMLHQPIIYLGLYLIFTGFV